MRGNTEAQRRIMTSFKSHSNRVRVVSIVTAAILVWLPLSAQQSFDRTKTPPPAKTPMLRVPAWTRSKLANGADLLVSEKHDLPLVSFQITFIGGSNQFDAPDRAGLGSLVA